MSHAGKAKAAPAYLDMEASHSSAPGFRWTSRWDIICVQTQEPTPMSNTTNAGERRRFSAPRKAATVLRLLRGESPELLARELGVTAATLAGWRDDIGYSVAVKSGLLPDSWSTSNESSQRGMLLFRHLQI